MLHEYINLMEDEEVQQSDETFGLTLEIMKVQSMLHKALLIKQAYQDGLPLEDLLTNFPEWDFDLSDNTFLGVLSKIFKLTRFEQYVLLLATGSEIDPQFAYLFAEIQGNELLIFPTIRLALDVLPEGTWQAFTAEAKLRRWQFIDIEVQQNEKFTLSSIQIDQTILFYLLGQGYSDKRLMGITEKISLDSVEHKPLQSSHQKIAEDLAAVWSDHVGNSNFPLIQLCGSERLVKQAIINAACILQNFNLSRVSITTLSSSTSLPILKQRWERAARLTDSVLLIDCDEINTNDINQIQALTQFLDAVRTPLVISSRERLFFSERSLITFDIPKLTQQEQLAEWRYNMGKLSHLNHPDHLDSLLQVLASQFNLNASTIQAICTQAISKFIYNNLQLKGKTTIDKTLWHLCRLQARPGLDHLATRIETKLTWDDLVLPLNTKQLLQQICQHVKYKKLVYDDWQMVNKQGRGLGINALFFGNSGLGKTTAAEIIAKELDLDLYRIDLSAVVSKYIGETEKNLSQIFDAAESGSVVLLFDEADALFGKRSEVKDSKDRYANMEVSYLLQRMETYRGLSILTTNKEDDMDGAFRRRLRFIVEFPFPGIPERIELWRRAFPPQIPSKGLDFAKLAQLQATGANIRSIALNAAFLAAAADEPLQMIHLLQATRQEMTKLGKSLTSAEIEDWV